MLTREKMEQQGHWLFKRRGFIPVALLLTGFLALHDATFFHHRDFSLLWGSVCMLFGALGTCIRCWVIGTVPEGTSGRNRESQVALSLNTTGWYSVVRNPLYLGNFLMWLGISLAFGSPLFVVTFVLGFTVFYERIVSTEEAFLYEKFGAEYRAWQERTPCIMPNFKLWTAPANKMNFRKALSEEYRGFCAFAVSICVVKGGGDFIEVGHLTPISQTWEWLAVLSGLLFFAFRLPRKTRLNFLNPKPDVDNILSINSKQMKPNNQANEPPQSKRPLP